MDHATMRNLYRIGASALAILAGVLILNIAIVNPLGSILGLVVGGLALLSPFLIFRKFPLIAAVILFAAAILAFFSSWAGLLATIALGGAGALAFLSSINERNRVGRL
jgi:hypothetical protein